MWQRRAAIAIVIVSQILAGALSGRVIYLSDCDGHDHDTFAFTDTHIETGGHEHSCQCPHLHVQKEAREVARPRAADTLAASLEGCRACVATVPEDEGDRDAAPPMGVECRLLREVRAVRLLI